MASAIVTLWTKLVLKGERSIESVPSRLRAQVEEELKKSEKQNQGDK